MRLKGHAEQREEAEAQRREAVRVVRARPVSVRRSNGRAAVSTYSIDLSGLGILLAGPDTLALGEQVRFRLSLGDSEQPVVGSATVVRIDQRGYRAIRLDEIADADRRRLVRFIFDCQREDRRHELEIQEHDARR
ncbi:MAG TPA: PilZ domain-containing protein [Solirubrobacteraceae bacterium]|nr:PilZ domain-containing protein [Solirubrobacteraceae bacterium]